MKYLITIIIILSLLGCSDLSHNDKEQAHSDAIPDQESWDTEIVITKGELKQALIKTQHLQKFNKKELVLLNDGVTAYFYDSLGRKSSQLTSQKAKIYQKTNDLYASQNVVVKSDSGVTLFTDSLTWIHETGMVSSEVPVKFITREKDTLYGTSFRSNSNLENWEIEQPEGVTPRNLEQKLAKDE